MGNWCSAERAFRFLIAPLHDAVPAKACRRILNVPKVRVNPVTSEEKPKLKLKVGKVVCKRKQSITTQHFCLHGIEILETLRNVFLEVAKIEEIKVNIHKWINNLSFDGK